MLTVMKDLPADVLGISAEGKVSGQDYKTILIPAVEEKLKTHRKIAFLYQLNTRFSDFELDAMLEDAIVGMKHLSAWKKVALVSDHKQINAFAKFFSHMIPTEFRVFKNEELPEAKKWISE